MPGLFLSHVRNKELRKGVGVPGVSSHRSVPSRVQPSRNQHGLQQTRELTDLTARGGERKELAFLPMSLLRQNSKSTVYWIQFGRASLAYSARSHSLAL